MPQIRPITDLRNMNEISEICHAKKEPVFITKNGYGNLVVMSMETYESMLETAETDAAISEAEYAQGGTLHDARSAFDSLREVNRIFFTYYAKQDKFVERLICEPSYRSFCNKLHAATLQHNLNRHNPYADFGPEIQGMINTFLVVSSLELYRQWIADGKKLPLEEVIELTGKLLDEGISGLSDHN